MGDALEKYVQDAFCNSFDLTEKDALKEYSKAFSYLGNQNNPPDLMLKGGDAVEIKKIQSPKSQLALNSSYPKSRLFSDSKMITQACKDSEDWDEKDFLYVVGHTKAKEIKYLWFVYGDIYAAEKGNYERIKNNIIAGINETPNVEFSETKELGRVNRVDPLGITYLRIRGMWGIDNPNVVFKYFTEYDSTKGFQLFALMRKTKFDSFPKISKEKIIKSDKVSIEDVSVKDPNNPCKLIDCKLIKNIIL